MRFWDSSALVPLFVRQAASHRIQDLLRSDRGIVLWWSTSVECSGAFARLEREGYLQQSDVQRARAQLGSLTRSAAEILPLEEVREHAQRLVFAHHLRAADALQLAAAIVWCQQLGGSAVFVCLDDRLRRAATIEGFLVMPYAERVHERAFDDFDD